MLIRLAESKDFEQLGGLMHQLNPADPPFDEKSQNIYEQILADPHFILLIAEDENTLTGSIYLNIIPNLTRDGRPYAIVENVVVGEQYRRHGIGRALMEKVIEIAWQVDCYKIMLLTGRKDDDVHAFYKELGFSADTKQAFILRGEDS